jgi:LPXTG-motif cell wall-anchored protein
MKKNNSLMKFLSLATTVAVALSAFSWTPKVKAEPNNIEQTELINFVKNPGFESDLTHWTAAGTIKVSGNNAHTGSKTLDYWSDKEFSFTVSQTISGLENGIYKLSAFTEGGGGEKTSHIFAKDFGGDELTATFTNTTWNVWKKPTIENIRVTSGSITIGVFVDGNPGNWGTIDDFELYKVGEFSKTIGAIKPVTVYTNKNTAPVLPDKVTAEFNDGTNEKVAVSWNAIEASSYSKTGTFTIFGTVEGTDKKASANIIVIEPLNIPAINNLSDDFIKGADVSMIYQIEENGGKFYDNGVEKDPLQILKDHGVNWIRLRIWNNPEGKGGGENDKEKTLAIAKRAKAIGLKFLLDFHYSDFWTDPGKQTKPAAWENMTNEQLEAAVYDYTKDIVTSLKAVNALPDMVQIGNEINGGMLWPNGKNYGEGSGGFDQLAKFLKSGIKGVKDSLSEGQNVKIMLHLAEGGKNSTFRWWFDEITKRGVEFDVIGLSYYPYWHGTFKEFQDNVNDISNRYNKEVAVAEVSYGYTLENGDSHGNIFGQNEADTAGYPVSLQGQASVVRNVMDVISQVPQNKGLGIFYWEPAWIPVSGAGWAAGEGNAWDNQAMFDFKGNALPSLEVFNAVSSSTNISPIVISTEKVSITVKVDENPAPKLPAKVKALYSNGSSSEVNVTWEAIDPSKYAGEGKFTVFGDVGSSSARAIAEVEVKAVQLTNYIKNPGFEADLTDWTLVGEADISTSDRHAGAKTLHYWSDKAFSFTISQNITGLENGIYKLSAWTQGSGGQKVSQIFAKGYGGDEISTSFNNTGWNIWTKPIIENIKVTNGTITVGAYMDANAENWGSIDDFELVKIADLPVTISSIEEVKISTEAGTEPVLPAQVTAVYSNGTNNKVDVVWNNIEASDYQKAGSFTVEGTVAGTDIKAKAIIEVVEKQEEQPVPQPTPEPEAKPELPKTGSIIDFSALASFGMLLMLAGVVLFKRKKA